MKTYRLYSIDDTGHIFRRVEVNAHDDLDALQQPFPPQRPKRARWRKTEH